MLTEILRGDFDKDLDKIQSALNSRKKILKQVRAATLIASVAVGDKVKLKNLRPKYINGVIGEVKKINRTTITISLPNSVGRFGSVVNCPANCLEKV